MKETIATLNESVKELTARLSLVRSAIEALQKICPHEKMVHTGNDSHKNYEKCDVCGKENDY